jgi:hypothetical protein
LNANAAAREDWAAAQERVRTVPAWASWVAGRRALVDAWTAQTRERPDLVAGYMHDYVDAATGLPVAWTINSPEPAVGTTAQQLKYRQAWVFYLRDYNIRRLVDAVGIFRATGDTQYRDWAAAQLDFYAANYNQWPLRKLNGRGRLFQHGLDEATATFSLADAARLLEAHVDANRALRWKTDLFYPMAENLKTVDSPLSNIGLWHAAAVARIGMRYHDAALVAWGLEGAIGTQATLAAGVNADNLWVEGSFSYNSYVIAALGGLSTAAALEGYAPATVATERQALARLLLAPLDYRFDNGMLPTPGDASVLKAVDTVTHASVYRTLPTWWGAKRASSTQTWDTLVDVPTTPPAEPTLPAPTTRNFPASRMAVLRAGNWQAFVHYGQATINHAQQEALSYELHHGTTQLSSDSGTVTYGSRYHSDYFTQGASHNVPLVNGEGQQRWAPGTVDQFDAVQSLIRVTQAAYRPGVDVARALKATASGLTETTTLLATDGVTRRLGTAYQTGCTVTPNSGLQRFIGNAAPPANVATAYWKDVVAYRADAVWSAKLVCGTSSYSYTVHGPAGQTVFIGTAPTTPLPLTRAVLYYEVTAGQAEFAATIGAQ